MKKRKILEKLIALESKHVASELRIRDLEAKVRELSGQSDGTVTPCGIQMIGDACHSSYGNDVITDYSQWNCVY